MLTAAPSGLSADENGFEIQSASRIDRRARMIPGAPMRRCAAESVVVLASSVGSTGPDGSHWEKFSQTSLSSEDLINYWREKWSMKRFNVQSNTILVVNVFL